MPDIFRLARYHDVGRVEAICAIASFSSRMRGVMGMEPHPILARAGHDESRTRRHRSRAIDAMAYMRPELSLQFLLRQALTPYGSIVSLSLTT